MSRECDVTLALLSILTLVMMPASEITLLYTPVWSNPAQNRKNKNKKGNEMLLQKKRRRDHMTIRTLL
jgi:hypothetical protein